MINSNIQNFLQTSTYNDYQIPWASWTFWKKTLHNFARLIPLKLYGDIIFTESLCHIYSFSPRTPFPVPQSSRACNWRLKRWKKLKVTYSGSSRSSLSNRVSENWKKNFIIAKCSVRQKTWILYSFSFFNSSFHKVFGV